MISSCVHHTDLTAATVQQMYGIKVDIFRHHDNSLIIPR